MAEKHDNQYTAPPLTEEEAIAKFRAMAAYGDGKGHAGQGSVDWLGLFTEFIHSEPSAFANVGKFLKARKVHPGSIQKRGGRTFWNQARDAVRAKALQAAIVAAPEVVKERYRTILEATDNLAKLVKRNSERMLEAGKPGEDGVVPPPNPFEASAIKTLAESSRILAEAVQKMFGEEKAPAQGGTVFNIHNAIVQSISERDKRLGVVD